MHLTTENAILSMRILKYALEMRSFVIEEVALADLLDRAWKPVGNAIRKQLSGVIDFKKGVFSGDKAFSIELWLTPEMFNELAQKQWERFEPHVQKYLLRAYDRAWREKGQFLGEVEKSEDDFLEDLPEDEWEDYLDDISGPGSTLDKKDSNAAKLALAAALASIARDSFLSYAQDVAVPAVHDTLAALRRASELETEADADAQELAKLNKARADLISKLSEVLDYGKHAGGAANLTVARAHHFGFLDWAEANQVLYYRVNSVLDGRLCDACAEMNGKIFAVSDAQQFRKKFLASLGDKELMKREVPFITLSGAKSSRGYVVKKADEHHYFPPFHPRCRCALEAVHDEVEAVPTEGYAQDINETDFAPDDFLVFENEQNAEDFADDEYLAWYKTLPDDCKIALRQYKLSDYGRVNNFMRGIGATNALDAGRLDRIKVIIEDLNKSYTIPVPENIVVFRKTPLIPDILAEVEGSGKSWSDLVGLKTVVDKGFMSASLVENATSAFAYGDKSAIKYRIFIPKGLNSLVYAEYARPMGEAEMIIKAARTFRIIDVDETTRTISMLLLD